MLRERLIGGRSTRVFTLQWHLTNACECQCTHCYDRSAMTSLPLAACLKVVRDFQLFCRRHGVHGQISLSGGNPLLYPDFWELYAAIVLEKIPVSILGNPLNDTDLSRLLALHAPAYYQVSLEGLRDCNDAIRGVGHFDRTIAFLQAAKQRHVTTHVMLTVQQTNMAQVIPLGIALESLTRKVTFNRVSQVGEAHGTAVPSKAEYAAFLREYLAAACSHPVLGIKENLFNILRYRNKARLFGGCTGYGCGAAFNFVALLPDGQVHACRKFPSLLGNITEQSLSTIYQSSVARQYRRGPHGCRRCPIRHHCRGCMAVIYGQGNDPLMGQDPFCFMTDSSC